MLNRLDRVGVSTFPWGRSILYGDAGDPGVFHQVSRWCSLLRSLQMLSRTLPSLLPPTLMPRIVALWLGWSACLLSAQSKTGGIYRGEPLHAEPLSRLKSFDPTETCRSNELRLDSSASWLRLPGRSKRGFSAGSSAGAEETAG